METINIYNAGKNISLEDMKRFFHPLISVLNWLNQTKDLEPFVPRSAYEIKCFGGA